MAEGPVAEGPVAEGPGPVEPPGTPAAAATGEAAQGATPAPTTPAPTTPEPDGAEPTTTGPAVALDEADDAPRGLSRRLAGVAVIAIVVAVTMTTVATVAPARASADQEFVATARLQGHRVPTGDEQELLVSAARKICDRRAYHATDAERRATALSPTELSAVQQTFADDARGFTVLALDTYCPD